MRGSHCCTRRVARRSFCFVFVKRGGVASDNRRAKAPRKGFGMGWALRGSWPRNFLLWVKHTSYELNLTVQLSVRFFSLSRTFLKIFGAAVCLFLPLLLQ